MTLQIVDPATTDPEHLASVDVAFSGTHIGGGIYLATNHNPNNTGNVREAIPQRSLIGQAEAHDATEIDFAVAAGADPQDYREDIDNDGTLDAAFAGFDISLRYGDRLSNGQFYDGPAISLLIANDPTDLSGDATVVGYPRDVNALNGLEGVLHDSSGTLPGVGGYTAQTVNSDEGGFFTVTGAQAVGGMSGGGTFLDFDADGDGTSETYLIGVISRAGTVTPGPGGASVDIVQAAAVAPHYADLAAAIEGLSGLDARHADNFARMVLLSDQTLGGSLTTVQGQFFHEDIYGGLNADTLLGGGGDDHFWGRAGADVIQGGSGDDVIDGGAGADVLTGDEGADWFAGSSFGGALDVVQDFTPEDGDVIDLSAFFSDLSEVVAATTEPGDGSIEIALPLSAGGGIIRVANTSLADLRGLDLNVACFTQGAFVHTDRGEARIEDLQIGDMLLTDAGTFTPLRAIHTRRLAARELKDRPKLWPIVIAPGALGRDTPSRTLTVSPQHRVLVDSKIARRMTGCAALLPAKALLALDGVTQPEPQNGCSYIHLVCDRHQIILVDGCWSESFFPGAQALGALDQATAKEYRAIFQGRLTPKRPLIKGPRARQMVARHHRNRKPLQSHDGTVSRAL